MIILSSFIIIVLFIILILIGLTAACRAQAPGNFPVGKTKVYMILIITNDRD